MKITKAKLLRFWLLVKGPLMVGVILGLIIGIIIIINNQGIAQRRADEESRKRQEELQQLLGEIQKGSDETNNHLDCILEYFSRRSRSGLFLEDIDKCRYKRRVDPQATAPEPQVSPEPSDRVAKPSSPRPPASRSTPRPRGQDRSFLDCLPAGVRKNLDKLLDKKHPARKLPCQR